MLKVWLPLTGTLENKGISNYSIVKADAVTFSANGKIGQCATAASSANITLTMPELSTFFGDNKTYSLACWVKVVGTATSGWFIRFGSNNCGLWWAKSAPRWVWNENDNGKRCANETISNDTTNWHHLTITVDKTISGKITTKQYVDGALAVSYPGSTFDNPSTKPTGTIITINPYIASVNDVRIYDHCLSAAEVKEISQGLVLHYKLDGGTYSQPNLLPCGNTYTSSSPLVRTSKATDGAAWVSNSAFEATPSTTYTISVECDGTLSNAHGRGNLAITDKPWSFWLYICNTDTTKNWSGGSYDTPVNLNSSNNNFRRIGNAYVWTYTLSSTQKYISVRTNTYSDGTNNITVKFWNLKIEKGNVYTPWSNTNSTTIADSSGYGHNGTITGNVSLTTNTARYSAAAVFSGYQNPTIDAANPSFLSAMTNCTVTWWEYVTVTGNNLPIRGQDGSHYIGAGSTSTNLYHYNAGDSGVLYINGVAKTSTVASPKVTSSYKYEQNKWVHFAFTNANLSSWTKFQLNNYSSGWPVNGYISDVRIYAIALSADDILSLYHTAAKVDNLGGLHTYELKETGIVPQVLKKGIVQHGILREAAALNSGPTVSYKPAANASNSCATGVIVDFSKFADEGQPLTCTLNCDISWSGLAAGTGGTFRVLLQGSNRKKATNSFAWEGANYVTNGYNFTSLITANSTSSTHRTYTFTIPATWFDTYNGSYFGVRTDYANGTGTITISNIKVTIATNSFKIKSNSIQAENLIEF